MSLIHTYTPRHKRTSSKVHKRAVYILFLNVGRSFSQARSKLAWLFSACVALSYSKNVNTTVDSDGLPCEFRRNCTAPQAAEKQPIAGNGWTPLLLSLPPSER